MDKIVISVTSGAQQGITIALIGLGLVLAFRATETFSFAHGQMMVLPAFIVGALADGGRSFLVALLAGLVIAVAISVAFQALVLQRTMGQPLFISVIATFGLASVLNGSLGIFFPGDKNYFIDVPGLPTGLVSFAGARLRTGGLVVAAFGLLLALLVAAFLKWTHVGLQMTAAGQDPLVASQGGIRVRRLHTLTWALVALLAASAGIAQGATNGVGRSVADLGFLAFPALILGGLTSVGGTIAAGVAIGIAQGFISAYIGGDKVDVLTYASLLIIILLKPDGFFGIKAVKRA